MSVKQAALEQLVARLYPRARLEKVRAFGVDEATREGGTTKKAVGYGKPLRLDVLLEDGSEKRLVFHTAHSDCFGHDRRADRAAQMLLSFDTFAAIPRHVAPVEVGAITPAGDSCLSLAPYAEFYLVTEFEPGTLYADELRQIGAEAQAGLEAMEHVQILGSYLAQLHQNKLVDPERYARALRDTVGSGEGIFGLLDAFGPEVPGAPAELLASIELRAVALRRKILPLHHRLSRNHGDFHPFNIVFRSDGELRLLDASRGCVGDPADDVAALAINFVFFALERPGTWDRAYRTLWQRFFDVYLQETGDQELFRVLGLFMAWRGLVVANPLWYPGLSAALRKRVLDLVAELLVRDVFEPELADGLFE